MLELIRALLFWDMGIDILTKMVDFQKQRFLMDPQVIEKNKNLSDARKIEQGVSCTTFIYLGKPRPQSS